MQLRVAVPVATERAVVEENERFDERIVGNTELCGR
jgi:hypothetical protein